MAQLQLDTIKLIVENSMRDNGYGGSAGNPYIENAWKDTFVTPEGQSVTLQLNLQNLRDTISKSIYDTLGNTLVAGTASTGSIPGVQNVINTSELTGDVSIYGVLPSAMPNPNPVGIPYPATPLNLSNINLNYDPILNPPVPVPILPIPAIGLKGAARLGDGIQLNNITDPTFVGLWTVIITAMYTADSLPIPLFGGAIVSAVNAAYGGPPTPANVSLNGVISESSRTVHIGD